MRFPLYRHADCTFSLADRESPAMGIHGEPDASATRLGELEADTFAQACSIFRNWLESPSLEIPIMATVIERRLLTSPATPVRLRKRKQARKVHKRADEEEEDKPAPDADKKDDKPADDKPEEKDEEEKEDEEEGGEESEDDEEGEGRTIEGYAAVFYSQDDPGTQYELWSDPGFRSVEQIAAGAFSRAIREGDDCVALFNHDANLVLGRTSSGTCRLEEDGRGLKYNVDPPDTQVGRDVTELIDRGDVSGSSFGFIVEQESWRESENPDGSRLAVRTIESVRLLDVSPCTNPAYASSQAYLASKGGRSASHAVCALGNVDEARRSYQRWRAGQADRAPLAVKHAAMRARLAEVETELEQDAGAI